MSPLAAHDVQLVPIIPYLRDFSPNTASSTPETEGVLMPSISSPRKVVSAISFPPFPCPTLVASDTHVPTLSLFRRGGGDKCNSSTMASRRFDHSINVS